MRSAMPGQRGERDVLAVEDEVLVDLVGDRDQVVLAADARRSASSSSRSSTRPVGLCGELSSSTRVRSVAAARARRRRRASPAGAARRRARAPPASATHGARRSRRRGRASRPRRPASHEPEQRRGDRLGGAERDLDLGCRDRARSRSARAGGRRSPRAAPGTPGSGAYWLWPARIASTAASSTAAGPSSSGKPWPRLIAPVCSASAVISVKIVVPRPASRLAARLSRRARARVAAAVAAGDVLARISSIAASPASGSAVERRGVDVAHRRVAPERAHDDVVAHGRQRRARRSARRRRPAATKPCTARSRRSRTRSAG